MIPIPQPVLENLAQHFGTTAAQLRHFAGGRQGSDGVIYAYPLGDTRRLLLPSLQDGTESLSLRVSCPS